MNNKLLEIFESVDNERNCLQQATELGKKFSDIGYKSKIRKVFHRFNVFGDNVFLNCYPICGESYNLHYVVEVEGHIFDPKLDIPIPSLEYLEKAYSNHQDLKIV